MLFMNRTWIIIQDFPYCAASYQQESINSLLIFTLHKLKCGLELPICLLLQLLQDSI